MGCVVDFDVDVDAMKPEIEITIKEHFEVFLLG